VNDDGAEKIRHAEQRDHRPDQAKTRPAAELSPIIMHCVLRKSAMINPSVPLALLLACAAHGALAAEAGTVTPYRPSVSTPAQLPAVAQL
jgi:hypothetical protein